MSNYVSIGTTASAINFKNDDTNVILTTSKIGGASAGLNWNFTTNTYVTEKQLNFDSSMVRVSNTTADNTSANQLLSEVAGKGFTNNITYATISLKYEHLKSGVKPYLFVKIKTMNSQSNFYELDVEVLASSSANFVEGDEVVMTFTGSGGDPAAAADAVNFGTNNAIIGTRVIGDASNNTNIDGSTITINGSTITIKQGSNTFTLPDNSGTLALKSDISPLSEITNGAASANKALVVDGSRNISNINNLSIDGNLNVVGTTTQIDSTTVTVKDGMFKYASDNSGNGTDFGWYGQYGD